ncbi:MAG: hypothetical protein R3B03_16600 [Nitrospirales bacterium]
MAGREKSLPLNLGDGNLASALLGYPFFILMTKGWLDSSLLIDWV